MDQDALRSTRDASGARCTVVVGWSSQHGWHADLTWPDPSGCLIACSWFRTEAEATRGADTFERDLASARLEDASRWIVCEPPASVGVVLIERYLPDRPLWWCRWVWPLVSMPLSVTLAGEPIGPSNVNYFRLSLPPGKVELRATWGHRPVRTRTCTLHIRSGRSQTTLVAKPFRRLRPA